MVSSSNQAPPRQSEPDWVRKCQRIIAGALRAWHTLQLFLTGRSQLWWDIVAMLGGGTLGTLWMIYSKIRQSQQGWQTAILIFAMPVGITFARRRLDQLLMPLARVRQLFPQWMLIAFSLAAPFGITSILLHLGVGLLGISDERCIQVAMLLGTAVAYALLRTPDETTLAQSQPPSVDQGHATRRSATTMFVVLLLSTGEAWAADKTFTGVWVPNAFDPNVPIARLTLSGGGAALGGTAELPNGLTKPGGGILVAPGQHAVRGQVTADGATFSFDACEGNLFLNQNGQFLSVSFTHPQGPPLGYSFSLTREAGSGSTAPGVSGQPVKRRRGTNPLVPALVPLLIGTMVNGRKLFPQGKRPPPTWNDPVSGALPGSLPEDPPFVKNNPRDKTPEPCRGFYDAYANAQRELLRLEGEIKFLAGRYWESQRRHNMNLMKFTIHLGSDTADLAVSGAAGVKGGMGIAKALHEIPDMLRQGLQLARNALAKARRRLESLIEELAELGRRLTRLGEQAEELATRSKAALAQAEELAKAVGVAEKEFAEHLKFVNFASQMEQSTAERNAIVRELSQAEGRLQSAEQILETKLQERVAIPAQQARLTSELDDVARQIDELKAQGASAEANAAAATAEKREPLRRADAKVRELSPKVKALEELKVRKQAFLEAESALESADLELKAEDLRVNEIERMIEDEVERAKASFRERWLEAKQNLEEAKGIKQRAVSEWTDADERFDKLLETLPKDEFGATDFDLMTPAQQKALSDAQFERGRALAAKGAAGQRLEAAEREFAFVDKPASDVDSAARSAATERYRQSMSDALDYQRDAKTKAERCHVDWDRTSKELQPYSHPGMNLEDLPEMSEELRVNQEALPGLQQKFDEAFDAEQAVKAQVKEGEAEIARQVEKKGQVESELKKAEQQLKLIAEDEERFRAWKPEIEGTIGDLKKQEDLIERKIGDLRDQLPSGATRQSLENELAAKQAALTANRQRLAALQKQADDLANPLNDARSSITVAQGEKSAKLNDLSKAKREQQEAEENLKRHEDELAKYGKNPDSIDRIRNLSKEWSDWAKPGAIKGFEELVKSGLGKFGNVWDHLFNGQSPEDIAKILVDGRNAVQKGLEALQAAQQEYDGWLAELPKLRGSLEQCKVQYAVTSEVTYDNTA